MAATLRTARLRLSIGRLPREELPGVAARALLDGADSPSLRVLAGLVGVELERAPGLLARALDELGMPVPSERDGWLGLAVEAAAELLAGDLEPAEAAGIVWEAWLALDAPEALAPLARLSAAWDDLVDAALAGGMDLEAYRLELAGRTRAEAARLVEGGITG
jgi:hypothetical protein